MAENYRNGWKRLEIAGNGLKWLEWLEIAGNGYWYWPLVLNMNTIQWPFYQFDCKNIIKKKLPPMSSALIFFALLESLSSSIPGCFKTNIISLKTNPGCFMTNTVCFKINQGCFRKNPDCFETN